MAERPKLIELTTESTMTRIQHFYPMLDEEAIKKYKASFKALDKDNSGDLNLQEVKYMMEKMGQAKTHSELKAMIAEVDTDGSGTINFHEFIHVKLHFTASSVLPPIPTYSFLAISTLERPREP